MIAPRIPALLAAVSVLALSLAGAALLNSAAQADLAPQTPTPPPQSRSSGAEWTVGELAFESHYPHGFDFTAEIRSSAGTITDGRIVWSHAPGTQNTRPVVVDPQSGRLTAEWVPGPGESTPPWVGVTYWWEVVDAAGNSFATEPREVEYQDPGHDWMRTESEDVIVFTVDLPASYNEAVMRAVADQRETYRAAWGGLLPYKPRAILFGGRDTWEEWQVGVMSSSYAGLTNSRWGGTVQRIVGTTPDNFAFGIVLHELAHLYQDEFTLMAPGSWFGEGNATFFERVQFYDYESSVRSLAASGELPALLAGTGPGVSGRNARRGYDIGYTFWKWLADNYGLEGHRQLIELVGLGIPRVQAIEQVTGLSAGEVERRWRVWLGASPVPPTLFPTPTFYFLPSPTPYQW